MKRNLILISLDTTRADVAYSGQFETLEKLRRQGITFLNTVSSAPLTPPSHATVFTGLQPYNHGIRHLFKERLSPQAKTIAEFMKNDGYTTGAVVSCPGMNRWYGLDRGFNEYDDEIPKLPDGSDPLETVDVKIRGSALKRADLVTERAIGWIRKNKHRPFFLFMHFFDSHWPYEAPELFGGQNPYEQEVAFMDHYLGLFLNTIEQDGILQNTDLLIFSDHGEDLNGLYLNDKGGEELGHPEESGHGCLLYDQTQKVVLIVVFQELSEYSGQTIRDQVRLVDVTPTILTIKNIQAEHTKFDGVSLLPLILENRKTNLIGYSETYYPEEQTAATNGKFADARNKKAFRLGNEYKIIVHLGCDLVEVYDLSNDPNETQNMIGMPNIR